MNEGAGLSLFFQAGQRPCAADIEQILAASIHVAQVSHRAPDEEGWLELVTSGMTFDLHGLMPGPDAPASPVEHTYGLPADIGRFGFEAIVLAPSAHIAAGATLLPVVRTMLGLAASLARELPITAVCWNPAGCWIEPKYFGRMVVNWLSDGVFPVLGLIGFRHGDDGVLESLGLAYFIRRELRVPRLADEPGSDTVRLAKSVIDHLIVSGPPDETIHLQGIAGETLTAAPSADGRHVLVDRIGRAV